MDYAEKANIFARHFPNGYALISCFYPVDDVKDPAVYRKSNDTISKLVGHNGSVEEVSLKLVPDYVKKALGIDAVANILVEQVNHDFNPNAWFTRN